MDDFWSGTDLMMHCALFYHFVVMKCVRRDTLDHLVHHAQVEM